jgi:hypothetical protein
LSAGNRKQGGPCQDHQSGDIEGATPTTALNDTYGSIAGLDALGKAREFPVKICVQFLCRSVQTLRAQLLHLGALADRGTAATGVTRARGAQDQASRSRVEHCQVQKRRSLVLTAPDQKCADNGQVCK